MLDHFEHALGVLSLLVFAGAGGFSLYAIAVTALPQWRRIARLAAGHIDVAFEPVTPAASTTLHVACTPSRRGDEAAAAPALQVR